MNMQKGTNWVRVCSMCGVIACLSACSSAQSASRLRQPPLLARNLADRDRVTREAAKSDAYIRFREFQQRRVAALREFWARIDGELNWIDSDGRKRSRLGEGHVTWRLPHHFALTLGKLGEVMMWVGADDERFWVIQKVPEQTRAFVCRIENMDSPKTEKLELSVHPTEVLDLLGLGELPHELIATPRIADGGETYIFLTAGNRYTRRVYVNASRWLPTRVDLLDATTKVIAISSRLGMYAPVLDRTGRHDAIALAPTEVLIQRAATEDVVAIHTHGAATSPASGDFDEDLFAFGEVIRSLGIPNDAIIVLDAMCKRPAVEDAALTTSPFRSTFAP